LGGEKFLNQFLRDVAEALRAVAQNAEQVVKAMKFLLAAFAVAKIFAFIAALGVAAFAVGVFAVETAVAAVAAGTLTGAVTVLGGALLSIPFVAILTTLALLTAGFVAFGDQIKVAGTEQQILSDVFDELAFQLGGAVTDTINALGFEFEDFGEITEALFSRVAKGIKGLVAVFAGLRAAVGFIFEKIKLEFKKFLLDIQRVLFRFKSGVNNVLNALGFEDQFDTASTVAKIAGLTVEVKDLNAEIEKGGTLFERFIRAGQKSFASIERRALDRVTAERDAAIIATENANRAAAKARAAAAARQDVEVDAGRTLESILGDPDADKAAKEREMLIDSLKDLEAAHFPVIAQLDAETEALNIINEARLKGIDLRVNEEQLIRRIIRSQIGANMTLEQASEEQQILKTALDDTIISLEEFEFLSRKASIAFLDSQRDAASGAQRAFLKLQQDATDSAAFTEMVFTDAFKAIEDSVVDFVQTGTFSLNEFFRNFAEQLIRLGTQQAIAGIGSAAGGLFGGTAAGGGGPQAGIGGLVSAGLSSLGAFQGGGQFTVGANTAVQSIPGIDNRLIAFRARDNEEVTVTPKNQGVSSVGPTNIVFNVEARDADSFKRSQSQLQNRALAGVNQARRRR
jgi:hypothetical protein